MDKKIKKFLIDLTERAIKTFLQSWIAFLGMSASLGEVNWALGLSTAGLAALISVLTSLASFNIGDSGTAGMV